MNTYKALTIIFCCVLAYAVLPPIANADNWNQMTKLEFTQPVEIPGRFLPAGTYWFVLQNNDSGRNLVQIFSEDWRQLYATLSTVPTDRQQSTDRTEIEFAERPHEQPEALLKWYYPGLLTGHEFLYSSKHERQFAREAKLDVLVPSAGL
jgi:Protein of unknown function (DUF2911)